MYICICIYIYIDTHTHTHTHTHIRKTKIFIKQNNIKYATINPCYLLHFSEVTYFDDGICL